MSAGAPMDPGTTGGVARPTPPAPRPAASGLIRWRAVLPLAVVLSLGVLFTVLLLDRAVRRGVEAAGTAAVGARVDLAEADVQLRAGRVRLSGLAVTDPAQPMRNLLEAEELVFDVGMRPALEGKVVIDTLAARGLRFGTRRTVSGAIPRPPGPVAPEEPGAIQQAVDAWMAQVKVPPLELSTLTRAVNVDAIAAESLATLRAARLAQATADSARERFTTGLRAADPRPTLDSAEALLARLRGADLRSLGLVGARNAVRDVRRTLRDLQQIDDRFAAFEKGTRASLDTLGRRLQAIPEARTADYAYARSLLQLPTVEVPAIGPQLFAPVLAEKVGAVMYWVQVAERYVPPGITRQMRAGPSRARASGTDVLFPKSQVYPDFLARLAELSLAIGGEGAAAGAYTARLEGLTTRPAVFGAPTTFLVSRTGAAVGPRDVRISGSLDHRGAPARDVLEARLRGIPLPTFALGGLGGSVALGDGVSELRLRRDGDRLDGRWVWRSTSVRWQRDSLATRSSNPTTRLLEDALWRALGRIDSVEIEARFTGALTKPALAVRTNIADAIAGALQAQLGDEIRRAEAQVRARVDGLVADAERQARARVEAVRTEAEGRLTAERARLEAQRAALEQRLRELARIPGIG